MRYNPKQHDEPELTKAGFLVYTGSVQDYYEWEFRAMAKLHATKTEERFSLGAKLLESLRGDAYIVAQDLGHTVLKKENAIEEIIEAVKKQIFPLQAQEAKELYRVGCSVGGVMSRQPGESMTSYTGRRKRWYRKLKELDNSLEISDTIRADLLLDNCGLDRKERLMILTAVGDKPSFEAIEKALITQHGKLHFLESKAAPKAPGFVPRGSPYKGKGKGKKGSFQPIAYLADPQDLFENYGEDDSVWDPENEEELVQADDNVTAFLAGSLEDATTENIELDVMEAFISSPEFDLEDNDNIAFMAQACQAEVVAYFARSKAKGKGKPMGKHAHGYSPRPSGLSIEDRRKKLKEVKSRSTCKVCGKKGHWAGDRECQGKATGASSVTKAAHLSATAISVRDAAVQTDFFHFGSGSESFDSGEEPQQEAFVVMDDDPSHPEAYPGFFSPGDFAEGDDEDEELVEDGSFEFLEPPPEGSDTVFGFGLHRGRTFGEVVQDYPDYFTWGIKETSTSPMLREFLVFCNKHYVFPQGTAQRRDFSLSQQEAEDLAPVREWILAQKSTKSRSKLSNLKPSPDGPCPDGCPAHAISRAGSNAHVIKQTCMKCGHRWSTPRPKEKPKNDYATCEHRRTDNRGSTRAVHKVWCLDCCTFVSELPQQLHKQQKDLAQATQKAPLKAQDLTRRVLQDVPLTQLEAGQVIKHYVRTMNRHLTLVEQTSSQELLRLLSDSIDAVASQRESLASASASAAAPSSSLRPQAQAPATTSRRPSATSAHSTPTRTPSRAMGGSPGKGSPTGYPPHAFMAVDGGDKEEKKEVKEQQVTVEAPELIGEPRVDELEQVDPFGHDGIFALLDEGCNSSCHSRSWRINAELKLKRGPRLAMKDTPRTAGTYKGIGGAETTCRKVVPICLKMEPSGLTVSGSIATNEIDGQDFPLLLSLQVQQKLGLKKDTRRGIVELTDYPGQFLRLYQHHRTGLLMIRLDHFGDKLSAGHQEFFS